jgi:serine/threonine protein kinase
MADEEYGVLSKEDEYYLKDRGYKIISNIGSSYDHLVFKAQTKSGKLVAIKYLEVTQKRKQKYLEREIFITDYLRDNPHNNIIKVYETIKIFRSFGLQVFCVMEFGDSGDLLTFFQKRKWTRIDDSLAKYWFNQLLSGVEWLHNCGIAHRDIKADNVILFKEGDSFRLKLADLEMAIFGIQNIGRFRQTIKCNTVCGSLEYAAPEIFKMSYNPFKADIYSLGVILHILITGRAPFKIYGSALLQLKDKIDKYLSMKNEPHFDFPQKASDSAKSLIKRMLDPNPENRISLSDIIESDWVTADIQSNRQFWQMIEQNH